MQQDSLNPDTASEKKPYSSPRLMEYGDFRILTRGGVANGSGSEADGGNPTAC